MFISYYLWCCLFLSPYYILNLTANESIFEIKRLKRNLPDAIIIGSKKSGTRALLNFIGAHPNVSTAGAEVHFFDRFYHMGLEWYRDQMPLSSESQITIEKTPKYLVDEQVPRRVYRMNPHIKLIVVFRDPVERAISEYVQHKQNILKKRLKSSQRRLQRNRLLNDSEIIKQMIYNKDQDGGIEINLNKPMIRNGLYINHLENWLKYFKLEQFVFINEEILVKSPSIELKCLENFLNLKNVINKSHFVHNVKKPGFLCMFKPLNSSHIKCLNEFSKGRKHPEVDKNILNDLRELYKPYNKQLFDRINQEPWWN